MVSEDLVDDEYLDEFMKNDKRDCVLPSYVMWPGCGVHLDKK